MPTLQCPRNHPVPFTDDERGGEVYCPVCGVVCEVPTAEAIADDPSQPLLCRNGHVVEFSEDERGGEVYCRSCGVVCEVPAAPASASDSPRRRAASVFTSAGETQVAANIVGRIPCPRCEQAVVYTVADYGETVYCTKCGASVTVGESLQQVVAARAEPAKTGTTPISVPRSRRRVLLALGSIVFLGGLAVAGVFVSWRFPDSMPFDATALPWNKAIIEGAGNATAEVTLPPEPPPPTPPSRPDLKIKIEMIDRLLKRKDVEVALDNAQSWENVLITYKIPKTDPRLVALEKAIPELKKKLEQQRPAPVATATPADKCLELLDEMLEAIAANDVPAGRTAGNEAKAMMKKNPELEKRYSERYEKQTAMLEDLAKKPVPRKPDKTVEDVVAILKEALELAQQNEVTKAMEARARGLFLAPRVAIDSGRKKQLNEQVKNLTTVIHRARGKRAVTDAERCFKEGDDEALKVLLAEARKDLPEFKEQEFKVAYKQAEALAKKTIAKPVSTEFGKATLFRHEYERLLDLFREGDNLVAAVEAADRARQRAPDDSTLNRVLDLTSEGIEAWILTTSDSDKDESRRAASRAALDKAKPWLGEPRWKKLDERLRSGEAKTP